MSYVTVAAVKGCVSAPSRPAEFDNAFCFDFSKHTLNKGKLATCDDLALPEKSNIMLRGVLHLLNTSVIENKNFLNTD